jgi:hypothetical protein
VGEALRWWGGLCSPGVRHVFVSMYRILLAHSDLDPIRDSWRRD